MTKMNKRSIGAKYEQVASEYLESQGYEILERNYRCRIGEIDLIARDGEYLVFCEVKYRSSLAAGHALEAVNWKKQRTIIRCTEFYLFQHGIEDQAIRFDVVGIQGDDIILIKNAF